MYIEYSKGLLCIDESTCCIADVIYDMQKLNSTVLAVLLTLPLTNRCSRLSLLLVTVAEVYWYISLAR